MNSLYVRDVAHRARIGERAVLCDRFLLRRRKVGKGISAGIIVVTVVAHVAAKGQNCVGIEQARPSRRDIVGLDLER